MPPVLLAVQGGKGTLTTVASTVKRGYPVLVLAGIATARAVSPAHASLTVASSAPRPRDACPVSLAPRQTRVAPPLRSATF